MEFQPTFLNGRHEQKAEADKASWADPTSIQLSIHVVDTWVAIPQFAYELVAQRKSVATCVRQLDHRDDDRVRYELGQQAASRSNLPAHQGR